MNDLDYFREFFSVKSVMDRTGLAETLPNEYTISIPSDTSVSVSLEECIADSINSIKELDKELILLWSGGIDSTLTFYALIDADVEFSVQLNGDSKIEHPVLFKKIVNGEFPQVTSVIRRSGSLSLSDSADICYITGEIGDQCCGSALMEKYSKEKREGSYKRFMNGRIVRMTKDSVVSLLGDQDFTTAEYLWALNFIFKYENVVNRLKVQGDDVNLYHFFNTDMFQIWAIQNYKTNASFEEWNDYKEAFKTYIYEQDGDEDYFINKTKVGSLKLTQLLKNNSDVEWNYV